MGVGGNRVHMLAEHMRTWSPQNAACEGSACMCNCACMHAWSSVEKAARQRQPGQPPGHLVIYIIT